MELGTTYAYDAVNHKFTGKERDSESGLDNFTARYFGSSLGRFMSPDDMDPEDHVGDPQGLNLYTYVQNNPTNAVDPDGHDCVFVQSNNVYVQRGDCSGISNGTYVPGTVNEHSGHYDPNTHTLSFQYEPYWGPNSNSASLSFFSIANVIPTHPGPTEFEAFASRIAAGEQNIEAFGLQVGLQVAGGILGRTIGAGIDALVAAKAAATEVSEVADLVAKAAGTVGNQSARASSKATALAAAEEWVGPGAKTLVDRNTGQIAGKISADGTKVYRITSLNKAQPYVNLESKMTGGNLHVRF